MAPSSAAVPPPAVEATPFPPTELEELPPVTTREQRRSAVPEASAFQTTCPPIRYEPGGIPLGPPNETVWPPVGTVPLPFPAQPSLGPVAPVGPREPLGPVWFQLSGFSPGMQWCSEEVSITRNEPFWL
jgi:hypothetical protein